MFDKSIYRLLVLNTASKCNSLQIMVFVNICSTWSMVQLNTRFGTWITRNDVNGVGLFHLYYLIILMAYLFSQRIRKFPNQVFNVWLVDLQTMCGKKCLETWYSPNDYIRKYLLVMKHVWNKNAFWDVNNKEWRT
jgi:hypothetical protein